MAHALVVDNDPSFGEATVDRLLRRGHEAVGRYTGEEALAPLLSEEFDVGVTDVRMPGMTGFDLCTSIATHRPDLPLLVVTAFGSPDFFDQPPHAGVARASAMSSPRSESKNKALVLEAVDTLFNKRDYVAAERFWSPVYIQQSAHIERGRDGLFNLIATPFKQFY